MRWGKRTGATLLIAAAVSSASPLPAGAQSAALGATGVAEEPSSAAPPVQAGRLALVYTRESGAGTCDSESAFRAWMAAELGGDPFTLVGPALATARLLVVPAGAGFAATLIIEDAAGRELTREARSGRACNDALDRLAIDVLLELFRPPRSAAVSAAPEKEEPEPEKECDPCKAHREVERLRDELVLLRRRMWRLADAQRDTEQEVEQLRRDNADPVAGVTFALSTGAFITLGLTNNVGGGVLLGGEVHSGIFAMALEGRVTLPSQFGPNRLADHFDTQDISRYQGALVPCARYWYVFGCAVLAVGAEVGYAPQTDKPTSVYPVWEIGPRLGAEIPLNKTFALRAWGEVLINPNPVIYHWLENGVEIGRKDIPYVAGFIGAGLVIHFGKKE